MLRPEVLPRASARPALPGGPADFTEAWLRNRRLSEHTRDAYRRDVTGWLSWCAGHGLDPLRATFLDVNAYGRDLEATPRRAQRSAAHPGHRGPPAVRAVQLVRLPGQAAGGAGQPGRRRGPAPRRPGPLRHRRADPGGGRRAAGRRRGGHRPDRRPQPGGASRCWPTWGCGSASWSRWTWPTWAPSAGTAASASSARAARYAAARSPPAPRTRVDAYLAAPGRRPAA